MTETIPKTKVLFVITKSNYGGAQRYIYDLATQLSCDPSYEVAIAFGGTGARGASVGALETKLATAHIRTIRIEHFMRDVSLFDDVRASIELWRVVRTEKPDVLHVTSSKAGGIGALIGRLSGVPTIIFTSHGLVFDESWRPAWQRALLWLFTWCTMLLAHATIQISQATCVRAQRMPFLKKKVHLIYNGIETPAFESRTQARAELTQGSEDVLGFWIGSIAELHPNKNLMMLVDAVAGLKREGVEAQLWLVGTGEMRGALIARAHERRIESQVHLPGYIENASRLIPAFDVFALPSAKEGLPYVLLEAGTAGVAVVASDISGNNDIIEHEKSGLLVPHSVKALRSALTRLVEEPNTRAQYGGTLKSRVQTMFSREHMYAQTVALYTSSKPTSSRSKLSR